MILYSDGMIEAHDRSGDLYSEGELLAPPGKGYVMILLAGLQQSREGWEQEDDITLRALEISSRKPVRRLYRRWYSRDVGRTVTGGCNPGLDAKIVPVRPRTSRHL